jgi:hypothetical protein
VVFNIDHTNAMAYANAAAIFSPAQPNRRCRAARRLQATTRLAVSTVLHAEALRTD